MDGAIGPHHAVLDVARPPLGEQLGMPRAHVLSIVQVNDLGEILEARALAVIVAEE